MRGRWLAATIGRRAFPGAESALLGTRFWASPGKVIVQLEMLTPVRTEDIVESLPQVKCCWRLPQCRCRVCGFRECRASNFLPDCGQGLVPEDDHELPVVATAALHHRSVGVEAIEQERDRQTPVDLAWMHAGAMRKS